LYEIPIDRRITQIIDNNDPLLRLRPIIVLSLTMTNYYQTVPFIDLDLTPKEQEEEEYDCEYGYTSDETESLQASHRLVYHPKPAPPFGQLRFWSDRFYLNATREEEANVRATSPCHCGSDMPPPLFPRQRFLQSLSLQAAILGTFGWSPTHLAESFPELLEKVPTLLLHGKKGMTCGSFWQDLVDRIENSTREGETDCEDSSGDEGGPLEGMSGEDYKESIDDSEGDDFTRLTDTTLDMAKRFAQSDTFQMSYVRCNWKKTTLPGDSSRFVSRENVSNSANNCTDTAKQERETRNGVHHPKFMLLLETSGNLVVLITTANMTPTRTVEGTWVQRFKPVKNTARNHSGKGNNDFGMVLQDFLSKISDAAEHQGIVHEFVSRHFPRSLTHLATAFHFEAAQVHLVPIIPGDYSSPVKAKIDKKRQDKTKRQSMPKPPRFFYGHQRVRYVLQEFAKDAPQLCKHKNDNAKSDRLLLQPTSLGGDWTRESFAAMIRGYMGYKSEDKDCDDDWVCGQADVVWPSDEMIVSLGGTSPLDHFRKNGNDLSWLPKGEAIQGGGGNFVFNSSQTFNKCGPDVISRFCLFRASLPMQVLPKVPHFKSVARVFSHHALLKGKNVHDEADAFFSWFLLTSACLSHGAQGAPVGQARVKQGHSADADPPVFGYRNFELGVLFTSRLRHHNERKNSSLPPRMYCFHPARCCCKKKQGDRDNVPLIHLPIPYNVRPDSYFERIGECDGTIGVMKQNPYFHKIVPHSRCVGNMMLTPFGRQLIAMDDKHFQQRQKRRRTV
jgi:hypothetical protein